RLELDERRGIAAEPAPAGVEAPRADADGLEPEYPAAEVEVVDGEIDDQRLVHLLAEATEVRRLGKAPLDRLDRAHGTLPDELAHPLRTALGAAALGHQHGSGEV